MTPPSRLGPVAPAALDADQLHLYRELVHGPRGRAGDIPLVDDNGALIGPFAVMAASPAVGDAVQRVGASLRYASVLDPLVREAAVLLVAAHHGSAFEWRAHEGAARGSASTRTSSSSCARADRPQVSPHRRTRRWSWWPLC